MVFSLKKGKGFLISVLLTCGTGALAGLLTKNSMDEFQRLIKPPAAPPEWVFPVVWSVLYLLMGISAAMIYLTDSSKKRSALCLYAVQLAVNFLWPIFFFNLKAYSFSFFWILLLLCLIIAMFISFYRINKPAAYLQIPYLLWVAFASYLTLMITILNK